ncbi:hypothetical protein H8959_013668 [Pygathrix nigripes]
MADKSKFIEYIDEALEKSKETALSRLFFTYQGIPYPITMCTSETFQALDTFEARHDDIVLASYPKCGSNWILHIVHELIFAVSKKKYEYPEFPVLECGDSDKYQRMKGSPSPRILATHLHYDKLPGSIFKNKAKEHAGSCVLQFPQFLKWKASGQKAELGADVYFDFAISWNKHLDGDNVKFVLYEDLKEIILASGNELGQSKCWEGCKEGTAIVQAKEDGGSGQERAMRDMRRGCILDIC